MELMEDMYTVQDVKAVLTNYCDIRSYLTGIAPTIKEIGRAHV